MEKKKSIFGGKGNEQTGTLKVLNLLKTYGIDKTEEILKKEYNL